MKVALYDVLIVAGITTASVGFYLELGLGWALVFAGGVGGLIGWWRG